jgi:DNA-binding NtrC family response regulator
MARVLVADDDMAIVASFEQVLGEQGHDVITTSTGEGAIAAMSEDQPDVIVMDIRMPGASGLEAFRKIKEIAPRTPVIMMTGYATAEAAIEAMKLGAFDYHLKPFEPEAMVASVASALANVRLMEKQVHLGPEIDHAGDAIVGKSESMQEIYKAIGRVAQTDATVLIRGETGTGKELAARAIYQHSSRADAPLVVVNCVAIPETLLESELFGYEKGAFTGANARRIGKFEQANGGTIFLDEIGDMPPGTQATILRVLQERSFERVGSNDTIMVDVRVIAATNRNLEKAIENGRFRKDLYHRLKVFVIEMPPLRQRSEDIADLAVYFLRRLSGKSGAEAPVLTEESLRVLEAYPWPGNVRELRHCIQRAFILTSGYPIQADDVKRVLESSDDDATRAPVSLDAEGLRSMVRGLLETAGPGGAPYATLLDLIEKLLLSEAITMTQGNQTQAAKLLGLTRPTLKAKMDKCGISIETTMRGT